MADVKIAMKRVALPYPLDATVDCTETSFGTPKAAIVIMGYGYGGDDPTMHNGTSIGFWDGTTMICGYGNSDWGVSSSTDTNRGWANDTIGTIKHALSTNMGEYTISNITDGVRLTNTLYGSAATRYATIIMFGGDDVSAKVENITPNTTPGEKIFTSVGFRSSIIFWLCAGLGGIPQEATEHIMAFGASRYQNGIQNKSIAWSSVSAAANVNANMMVSENRCCGQFYPAAWGWNVECKGISDTGFTLETRVSTGSDYIAYLALKFPPGYNAWLHTLTSPTSTGLDSVTGLGFQPTHVLSCMGRNTVINVAIDNFSVSIGTSDGTTECNTSVMEQDATVTSNNAAVSREKLIDLMNVSNSGILVDATLDSFDPDGYTLDYTNTDGSARLGWAVAFGATENKRVISTANGFLGMTGG